jgi:hypothetical protein
MLADLDLLLTAVFATADDLLSWRKKNARRSVTDAEVVTLAVAQAIMDISSDREFLEAARGRLGHLFPKLPLQPGYWKRRRRLTETIEWLMAMFAQDCPGYFDNIVLVDSTPVECGRSVDTARRSDLAPACAHHYSRSHSRWFWGMRLHLLAAPDGTPRAAILASADQRSATSRCVCLSAACMAASWSSATRATPAATSKPRRASASARRSCAPPAKTSRTAAQRCPGSVSGSRASSGRSRTASASNATAPGPSTASAPGSPPNCSRSPRASGSTTTSTSPPAASLLSPPRPRTRNQSSRPGWARARPRGASWGRPR